MFARVMRIRIQKNKLDQAVATYRDSVLPVARRQRGFRGATLLTDRATGTAVSITLWETEAALEEGERTGYVQEQLAKFAPLFSAAPERSVFEVAAGTPVLEVPTAVA